MNNQNLQTGSISYSGESLWIEKINTSTFSWILIQLPYKVNHIHWEQLEIVIPILQNTGNIEHTDEIFNTIQYTHKQQKIWSGLTYLNFWVNYDNIHSQEELENKDFHQDKTIFLNKLYILENQISHNNYNYIIR